MIIKGSMKSLVSDLRKFDKTPVFSTANCGKLILFGEHAVLYGARAIATPIALYSRAYGSIDIKPSSPGGLSLSLMQLGSDYHLTYNEMTLVYEQVQDRYGSFKNGQLSLKEVLQSPEELFIYSFISLIDEVSLSNEFIEGIKAGHMRLSVKIDSQLLIGAGMGSSSSVISSFYRLLAAFFLIPLSTKKLMDLICRSESLVHGVSSGIDPCLCVYQQPGIFSLNQNKTSRFEYKPLSSSIFFDDHRWFWVNTGKPNENTGACVESVALKKKSQAFWKSYQDSCLKAQLGLQEKKSTLVQEAIYEQHRYLNELGVVPLRVNQFIEDIERNSWFAKISGAGALSGDAGGIVIVYGVIDEKKLSFLCQNYGYSYSSLEVL